MRRRWVQPRERNWIVSRKPCHPGLLAYDCESVTKAQLKLNGSGTQPHNHTTTQQRHRPIERPDIRRRLVGPRRRWSWKSEQPNPGSSRGQDTQQRRQGTCVKGDAGDEMQGRWNCSCECEADAMRCEAMVRACISIGCEKQRESPLQRRIACVGTRPIREAARAFLLAMGEWRGRGWRNPRAVGWAEKWAADRSPASEAPARPTPASSEAFSGLRVGWQWVDSGLAVGWAAG